MLAKSEAHLIILCLQVLADEDSFYSVRSLVTSADNTETEFLSSVKAKAFLESGLSDLINAWVLPNGAVIAVSFQITNMSQPLTQAKIDNYPINSKFYLHHVDQAPV